jgi:hypothetical protein
MKPFQTRLRTLEEIVDLRQRALARIKQRLDLIRAALERANTAIDRASAAQSANPLLYKGQSAGDSLGAVQISLRPPARSTFIPAPDLGALAHGI